MVRHYNFSPGPAMLPTQVMEQAQREFMDWQGRGLSVMEDTHRGPYFDGLMENLQNNLRKSLLIPDDYHVIFAQGGATMQNALLPLNILGAGDTADYLVTGAWSEKTWKDATSRWDVSVCRDMEEEQYRRFPGMSEMNLNKNAKYLHYAMNETIHGVVGKLSKQEVGIPLVTDISSCILSEHIDVSEHDMLYAGAQKNLGPAGIGVVIISDEFLSKAMDDLPTMLSWKKQAEANSMQNTAPTFTLYMLDLVVQWVVDNGGVDAFDELSRKKSSKLYNFLDGSDFYKNQVVQGSRSVSNIPFILADSELNQKFVDESTAAGLLNLKGHRSVGGMRASIYNSMPMSGVDALISFLKKFEAKS